MADISKFVNKLRELGEDVTEEDFAIPEVSPEEKIESQVLYTAIMTDTLLDEGE